MNYCKIDISTEITNLFEETKIEHYIVNDETWKFSVFVSSFDNIKILDKLWQQLSDVIASSYQTNLNGEENLFEKWNIYILYICKESVSKNLKAKIENDKFSSRKIVSDNINEELTEELINRIIMKHITHSDLIDIVDNTETKLEEIYVPNDSSIWSLIPTDKQVSGNLELQKNMIKQLKACCNED
jgi:hypothetical protein